MQVALSFGPYACNVDFQTPGPYTCEELGITWLRHVAGFSQKGMLYNHQLILLVPKKTKLPDDCGLELWGSHRRFDENSGVEQWPLGANLVFQQILWLGINKKLSGPFLWVEPDCIPVVPDWLDRLDSEYRRCGKPFMGANVEASVANKTRIPRHMTGNAIYPDQAHTIAPKLLEARATPWDVWAAEQVLPKAYFTRAIQHDYRHEEIRTRRELADILLPDTVLFHSDKFGAIARLLGQVHALPAKVPAQEQSEPVLDDYDGMLKRLIEHCGQDKEFHRKFAYAVLEHNLVSPGYRASYAQHRKKHSPAQETVQSDADTELEPEPAT